MAEKRYTGIGVSDGIRIGKTYVFEQIQAKNTDRNISEETVDSEIVRFQNAVQMAITEIESLIVRSSQTLGQEKSGVIKGQKSILSDPAYCPEIEKLICKNRYSSEKAVKQVTEKFALLFENLKNDYMKERAADVRDVGNRLLSVLSGKRTASLSEISSPVILVAEELSPSDTIQLNKDFILAFATQKGGKTSHTAIFAKSMGIPASVGLNGIMESAKDGQTVILDGAEGICILDPQQETLEKYQEKADFERRDQLKLKEYAEKEAITCDGRKIFVAANIGSFADTQYSLQQGAEAVGLLRTEQLYLSKSALPSEEEQFMEYKNIAQAYASKEVIVRTMDIGGDKALEYLKIPKEENPFLGYRAIRLCLEQKELFLVQLRAILRASAFGNLAIMFPMISGYDELIAAKSVLEEAKSRLRAENMPYNEKIKVGIMVEIPSAALMADVLAQEVDFFSIGTNDLVQYTLAVDRGNEKVSYLYDYFHPAVIRLIKTVADAAHVSGIPVGMCGGMAGDPAAAPLLVGLKLDELSMAAGIIPKIKYVIGKINSEECKKLADLSLKKKTAKDVRDLLNQFNQKCGL